MLVEHLRSSDAGLRTTVARALRQLGGSRTLYDQLTRALGEAGLRRARQSDGEVLVGFAKHQAIPGLQAALQVGSMAEKIQALKHLGNVTALMAQDPAAALKVIAPLLDAQREQEPVVIRPSSPSPLFLPRTTGSSTPAFSSSPTRSAW